MLAMTFFTASFFFSFLSLCSSTFSSYISPAIRIVHLYQHCIYNTWTVGPLYNCSGRCILYILSTEKIIIQQSVPNYFYCHSDLFGWGLKYDTLYISQNTQFHTKFHRKTSVFQSCGSKLSWFKVCFKVKHQSDGTFHQSGLTDLCYQHSQIPAITTLKYWLLETAWNSDMFHRPKYLKLLFTSMHGYMCIGIKITKTFNLLNLPFLLVVKYFESVIFVFFLIWNKILKIRSHDTFICTFISLLM